MSASKHEPNSLEMLRKIKVKQLNLLPYADESYGTPRVISFTCDDIKIAVSEGRFETRSFQADIDELKAEWNRGAKSYEEYLQRKKKYHIERIAFFVKHRPTAPIKVRPDLRTIVDGQHRVWAARYLNEEEIEVRVEETESAAF